MSDVDIKALAVDLRTAFVCDPTPELSERQLAAILQAVEAAAALTVRGRIARQRRSLRVCSPHAKRPSPA
jgi:hypothetical protein